MERRHMIAAVIQRGFSLLMLMWFLAGCAGERAQVREAEDGVEEDRAALRMLWVMRVSNGIMTAVWIMLIGWLLIAAATTR